MSQRSTQKQSTVPIGVGILGLLVLLSGWLLVQGLPFLIGCAMDLVLAAIAIVLLVPQHRR